jgi:CSLREA domain-containing protein
MAQIGSTTPRPSARPSTACRIRRLAGLLIPSILATSLACRDTTEPAPTPADAGAPAFAAAAAGHRTVTSLADPGDGTCNAAQCTLREALADPGSTDISFAAGLTGAVTLAAPQAGGGTLVIRESLTIAGPGAGITIRRRATDPQFRILTIEPGATVALANLTLRNGKTDRVGGGIVNFGTLMLRNCTVAGNASSQHGGGIDNHGPLTLEHTTVANNSAAGSGGGIDNHGMTLTVTNSSIVRNSGSGIESGGGTLAITNTAVSFNSGRGIILDWGHATLEKVRILGNSGGGIALHQGTIALTNSTVSRNSAGDGGGIVNSAGGRYTIANSTISNNAATGLGGGIYNTVGDPFGRLSATVRLTNSTVSGNSAGSGGGIRNSDRLGGAFVTVINSTIASNSARATGGGIDQEEAALESSNIVSLVNSLVARNTAPTAPDVTGGAGASFSLIGDGTGSGLTNSNGNQVGNVSPYTSPIDPRLGPLADNGGPTATRALEAGSPAIDAASSPDCPATDQRGVARPQGAACDIGSYERE